MGRPVIKHFIDYNPNVGPLQGLWVGYPGTGKSSHAIQVVIKILKRKDEAVLAHGDLACEWKHFLRYSQYVDKILVLIPEEADIQLVNFKAEEQYEVELEFKTVSFVELDITQYLVAKQITVVYDDCFDAISKTVLWTKLVWQLISRTNNQDLTITYLCHEAGNYYPQTAKGEQWRAVDQFCDYFVFFRKRGIRALLLTQLESEVYDRLRKKCIYKVYRICYPTNRTHARAIKKYILKMKINNYHLFFGDLFNPMQRNKPTKEISRKFLMIPRVLIKLNGGVETNHPTTKNRDLFEDTIRNVYSYTESIRETARLTGRDRSTIRRILEVEA